jgi:hypothetical protein
MYLIWHSPFRSSPPQEVHFTSQIDVGDDGYLASRIQSSTPKEVRVTSQIDEGDDGYLVMRSQIDLPEQIYEELNGSSREATGSSVMPSTDEVCFRELGAEVTEQCEMTDLYENVASSNIYSNLE